MSGRGERGGRGGPSGGGNEPAHQRYSNLIHDSEVFLAKLREFKPQSLGCLEARRKSSSTLIFPNPQQACMGPSKCPRYPHHIKPTTGYWIECHGPGAQAGAAASGASTAAGSQHQTPARKLVDHRDGSIDSDSRPMSRQEAGQQQLQPALGGKSTVSSSQDDLDHLYRHAMSATPAGGRINAKFEPGDNQTGAARPARETVVGQAATVESAAASQQAASVARRRLNKRTMTRDDIDLHKPRRTPNITITEPSFSQATTVAFYGAASSRRPPKSQTSQDQPAQDLDGQDQPHTKPKPPAPLPPPPVEQVKLQIQGCQSIEAHELSLGDDSEPPSDDFLLYRHHHQHRPSVIREFSDQEEHEAAKEVEQLGVHKVEQRDQEGEEEDDEDKRDEPSRVVGRQQYSAYYSGLSTDTFQKRPYQVEQQAYLQRQAALAADMASSPSGSEQQPRGQDLGNLELISFGEENYEKHYYGREHWNYFTNDELLGPVMLSLKQEVNNQRDHFHVLLRTVSYTLHGTIPASTICADRYDREAIVRELSEIAKLKPPLMLGQLPSTPDELLKLDHIFIKTELKVGVINIREGQAESEEAILGNKEESPLFTEFLELLGDRITLKGFDRYKGGLDTVHNLTGTESVYTMWRNIEIMFHVSTMLPHEENDPQKLQKKRHIGNDIVCVAFIESDDTLFWPGCIKSYFLHTFITVQTSPKPPKEGEKRKYLVSCVCRNEVQYAFKPFLVDEDEFFKSDFFREWLLVKIVNGERASYSAPKFARMQDRTRSQLLEDIITNLANHLVTGQIPKPYRRGSWRPLGHTRASSPLEDSMKDYFEDYDQLAKDFCQAFCGPSRSMLCDVVFKVKDRDGAHKLVHGVRAIMAIRSRTFLEMLYGFVPPGAGATNLQNQTSLRAIEIKALSGESSGGKESVEHTKSLLAKRGSVGADPSKKIGEKERRQSMLPNLSKSIVQKPNYLTVPTASSGGGPGVAGGSGTGGMIKNAFNRLVSGNWSGWSGNIKGYKGEAMRIKVDQNKTKVDLNSLAICKEIAKIDAEKLAQREFEIKEFDYDTFQQTVEYIHNGQCKLSYETIPGLICAAEHYDLPDLLHACFHHANTHIKLAAAPKMMNALYQSSCFYVTAMQLLDSIYEYIDPLATEFFSRTEYHELNESVFTALLSRKSLQVSELGKFQAMDGWARQQILNKQQKLQQLQQQKLLQRQQSGEFERSSTWDSGSVSKLIEPLVASTNREELDGEYRSLMIRLNKEVNIKLDKISSDDLVKIVLPTKVFNNDKIFEIISHDSRMDY